MRGDSLPGVVPAKVVPRYAEEFSVASISRNIAEAVWDRYKADGYGLNGIPSLAEQCVFARNLDILRSSGVAKEAENEEDS